MLNLPEDDYLETPPELFSELNAEFNFDLDAAASGDNFLCINWLGEANDALRIDWSQYGERIFCNPPYSKEGRKDEFIMKAWEASRKGSTVVMILPAKVNTHAFHFFIWDKKNHCPYPGVQVRFPEGRYQFYRKKKKTSGGQNECMIVVFSGQK